MGWQDIISALISYLAEQPQEGGGGRRGEERQYDFQFFPAGLKLLIFISFFFFLLYKTLVKRPDGDFITFLLAPQGGQISSVVLNKL